MGDIEQSKHTSDGAWRDLGNSADSALIALRVERAGRVSLERLVRAALGPAPTAEKLRPIFERTPTGVARSAVLFEATSTIRGLSGVFDALKPVLHILLATDLQATLAAHGMNITLKIDIDVSSMPVGVALLDDEVRTLLDLLHCPIELGAWGQRHHRTLATGAQIPANFENAP